METSKLSRVGVLFGHANFFFTGAAAALAIARHNHDGHFLKVVLPVTLVLASIFLISAIKSWKRFSRIYRERSNKRDSELVHSITPAGTRKQFIIAYLVSFFIPIIGTAIMLIVRRKFLKSRYAALHALAIHVIIAGIHAAAKGFPPVAVLLGLIMVQTLVVHFRRAIICAETSIPTVNYTAA